MEISSNKMIKNHGTTNAELGKSNRLTKIEKEKFIHSLIKKIFEKLDETDIDNVQYTIDRFEQNYAVCENRNTGDMVNVDISKLPENIHEGDILTYKNNIYSIDENKRKEIEERINEKIKNIFED